MMKNILIYIEPHPIRNYYEEFCDVGMILCDSIFNAGIKSGYDFRFFSNDFNLNHINLKNSNYSYKAIRPTLEEKLGMQRWDGKWDLEKIKVRNDLCLGKGKITKFYYDILKRIHKEFQFDAILLWSDNGAVRKFAKDYSIKTLFGEYGPTRYPFHQTIYFDINGVNYNPYIAKAPILKLNNLETIHSETWIYDQEVQIIGNEKHALPSVGISINHDFHDKLPFEDSFVFIPLQLADDLNTQISSKFKSPLEFLEEVIPKILKAGLKVVVKGHPAAELRPYNLIAEIKALEYAERFQGEVSIIPRDASKEFSLSLIRQSILIITINSSIGFEAVMLGKTVLLCGDAHYDVGLFLKSVDLPQELDNILANSHRHQNQPPAISSFLLSHYYHPIEMIQRGDVVTKIFDYLFSTSNSSLKDFWQGWSEKINFGYKYLNNSYKKDASVEIDVGPIAGNRLFFESRNRKFNIANDLNKIFFEAELNGEKINGFAKITNGLMLAIDSILIMKDKDQKEKIIISGWCLDKITFRPPSSIFLASKNGLLVSVHRLLVRRSDVSSYLGVEVAADIGFSFEIPADQLQDCENFLLLFLTSDNFIQISSCQIGSLNLPNNCE